MNKHPVCPDCGARMSGTFTRVSVNSQSAVRVRCEGKDLSHHEFTLVSLWDFAQFFPGAPVLPDAVELAEAMFALYVAEFKYIQAWEAQEPDDRENWTRMAAYALASLANLPTGEKK